MKKVRVDQYLVDNGLVSSRSRARALIMEGKVLVNDVPVTKAGTMIPVDASVRLRGSDHPYVSRGGLKLEGALKHFSFDFSGLVVMDVGASTGGFTDCLLMNGAAEVHAIDVGYGQLHWKLRNDSRVHVHERTNIRHVRPGDLEPPPQAAVIDVSFISLRTVLPVVFRLLPPESPVIALIKPQFEVGPHRIGKGGVVREERYRQDAVDGIRDFLQEHGATIEGVITSPIKGPKGNVEYLIGFTTPAISGHEHDSGASDDPS